MKNQYISSLLALTLIVLSTPAGAQTALPYYTGFDNVAEKSGWTEYKLGVDSAPYEWSYSSFAAYSNPECLSHNYPVGGSQQTDDWFVSPEFNFSAGATIDSLRYAFSGFGTPMAGDTIAVYLLAGSADPAAAQSVTVLYNFTDSAYINDDTWRKTDPITIPATSGPCYIAFRYTTVVNWLDTRLDNLSISGQPIGLEETRTDEHAIVVYPNPVKDVLSVDIPDDRQVEKIELTDMRGRVVKTFEGDARQLPIGDLLNGHYLLRIHTTEGIRSEKVVVE